MLSEAVPNDNYWLKKKNLIFSVLPAAWNFWEKIPNSQE